MKLIKVLLFIMVAAGITLALGGNALAFHRGGVADCAGCHTMHNSIDNQVVNTSEFGHSSLLKQADPSSVCLDCHADYGQLTTDGSGWGAGGDFYWLTKDWAWTAHGHAQDSLGPSHGHSIIVFDKGLESDPTLTYAPGGQFDSRELSCASCHDPHGKGDNPVLLRINDQNYAGGTAKFPADPVVMINAGRETIPGGSGRVSNTNHSAYGSNLSQWCAACHWDFDKGTPNAMHPTGLNGVINSEHADNYNRYISTGDMTGGPGTAGKYYELVAFETGEPLDLLSKSSDAGPQGGVANVACVTCHRAHASAFKYSGRWDFEAVFLADSHPIGDPAVDGSSATDKQNSYYGNVFVDGQRSLCNKCHAQDQG